MDSTRDGDPPEPPRRDAGVTGSVKISGEVARGSIWSISGRLSVLIASLVGTPFTLRLLEPDEFGLWSLILTIMTYLVLVDLGMATTSTKFAGEAYAKAQPPAEAKLIWTAAGIAAASSTFVALTLAVFASRIAVLLSVPPDLHRTAVAVLRVASVTLILRALVTVVNTPALVRLRWKGLTFATAGPAVALALVTPIGLVLTDGGIVMMALLALAAGLLALAANAVIAIRLLPSLLAPRMARDSVRAMSSYGTTLTASALVVLPLVTADRFLLAHYWSPAVVAPYAVAISLAVAMTVVPVAAADPLFPAFVRMIESRDWSGLRVLYGQASRALFLIITPAVMFLAFVGAPFLRLYAGADYGPQSVRPLFILLVGVAVNALAYIPYNYLLACGRLRTVLLVYLFQTVPYLLAASWLISRYQAVGAAMAWTARVLCDSLFFFWIVARDHRLKLSIKQLVHVRSPLLLAGLGSSLTVLTVLQPSLLARVASVCVLAPLYATLVFRYVLAGKEREIVSEQLRRRVHRPAA